MNRARFALEAALLGAGALALVAANAQPPQSQAGMPMSGMGMMGGGMGMMGGG